MDNYRVWEIISFAWTEIGLDEAECRQLAQQGMITAHDLPAVDRMIFKDVCASFAFDSFLIFPLMLWIIMPDWGYSEDYLRKRMERWYGRPYWRHWLNPLRWLGYPLAALMALRYRTMLRRAVLAG